MSESSSPDEAAGTIAVVQSIGSEEAVPSKDAEEQTSLDNAVEEKNQSHNNDEASDDGFHDAIQATDEIFDNVRSISSYSSIIEQAPSGRVLGFSKKRAAVIMIMKSKMLSILNYLLVMMCMKMMSI